MLVCFCLECLSILCKCWMLGATEGVQAKECGLCCVQALAQARVEEATFDASRLVDFAERLAFEGPATQLTPLVRMLRRVQMRS